MVTMKRKFTKSFVKLLMSGLRFTRKMVALFHQRLQVKNIRENLYCAPTLTYIKL